MPQRRKILTHSFIRPALACGGVIGLAGGLLGCQGTSAAQTPLPVVALASHGPDSQDKPPATSQQLQDIQWLESILTNPSSEDGIRSGAAERLINMNRAEAASVLKQALHSDDMHVVAAVVEAMHVSDALIDELLEPAVEALPNLSGSLLDSLSVVLTRYDEAALRRIASAARDDEAAADRRLGPIHALGSFRSKAAAVELMRLLNEDRDEPGAILDATCAALQRGTGLPYGNDPEQWRQWWSHAKDQPREEWMGDIVQRLSEQLAAAEQRITVERERARQTEQRLAESYRTLFATLSFDDQLSLLPSLLADPLASIRGFALDRVSRLLRDSVRIGETLQDTIAQRLDDEVPGLRVQTVRLLDQLGYSQTSEKAAARLEHERESEVITALLDVLIKRPSARAAVEAKALLDDEAHGSRAAHVIWLAVLAGHDIDEQMLEEMRVTLRTVVQREPTPEHLRLLARLGTDADASELEPLLDGDDERTRQRVAEGFLDRGHRTPLIDRSHDATVYPYAVRALLASGSDFTTLRSLVSITPPEQWRGLWTDAVQEIAASLDPEQMLQADDLLAGSTATDTQLRISLLEKALDQPAESLDSSQRDEIAIRLTRLLLDTHQATAAHELIENINGDLTSPSRALLRFEAAALAGEFDLAWSISPVAEQWVELLVRVEQHNPNAALPLHNEIIRRFDGELGEDLQNEVEAVHRRLQLSPSESPA